MNFLARIRACLDHRAYPYERRVCLWEVECIVACALLGALAASAPAWVVLVLLATDAPWWQAPAVSVAGVYLVHRGGWLGMFAWVDLGPGEAWRSFFFGGPYVPNIACETLEKFTGYKESSAYSDAENAELSAAYDRDKLRPTARWQGDPGSGRYDVLPEDEVTLAVRLHHKYVRPRLRARGVRGYSA